MRVMGISPFHDSSVALCTDGKIEFFAKEERLSRVKRDKHPFAAVQAALDFSTDIDVATYCPPTNVDIGSNATYLKYIEKNVRPKSKKIIDLQDYHHLQHASIAFYNSGFDISLVIVADRNGSYVGNNARESETVFVAQYPYDIHPIYKNFWLENTELKNQSILDIKSFYENHSKIVTSVSSRQGLVKTYESATTLIGQHILENGKTMGLSAYGKENKNFQKLFLDYCIGNDEYFFDDYDSYGSYASHSLILKNLYDIKFTEENYQKFADYAYQVQKQSQEALASLVKDSINSTGIKNVCLSGGYALNVVANAYLVKQFPEVNFYFEPLADDSGTSIGGAMYTYRRETEDTTIYKLDNTFFHGKTYNIDINGGKICNISEIAKHLANGKSVGVFHGKAEAGPRALGHRSILFDARNQDAKKIVNRIKKREWYRPFAGMILLEDVAEYFDLMGLKDSQHMTVNFDANKKAHKTIPGVIHIDGTCRIQTVSKNDTYIYELLREFKKITGVGAILNTSFNLAGQPLVETPKEALEVLHTSDLDYLWFPEIQKLIESKVND